MAQVGHTFEHSLLAFTVLLELDMSDTHRRITADLCDLNHRFFYYADNRKSCPYCAFERMTAECAILELKRQALWCALVGAHQSNGLRLGEAQIESDLVMDMAVKSALEKKGRSD